MICYLANAVSVRLSLECFSVHNGGTITMFATALRLQGFEKELLLRPRRQIPTIAIAQYNHNLLSR
jgi:hypothetical protein